MRSPSSQKIPGNRGKIKACVRAIRRGGVVIFPTETVYALACDSSNKKTLRKLCKLKGRDRKKPMQLLLGDFADLGRYARLDAIPQDILRALAKLWPGPLTAVLPATSAGRAISGRSSIGVRMPAHRLALSILKNAGVPVAATSANLSGGAEPVSFALIPKELKNTAQYVLRSPRVTRYAKASTVVDLTGPRPKLLRQGSVSMAKITRTIYSR
ncbi:MAG: L-threonylcarbamoyladenylate synthase [Elusimicrobiota bacterium]